MKSNGATKFVVAAALLVSGVTFPAWSRAIGHAPNGRGSDEQTTLAGLVSDSNCKGGPIEKGTTRFSCTHRCIEQKNAGYVLVMQNGSYVLDGHKDELGKLAGGNATVTGHLNGNTLSVDTVTAAR